MTEPPLPNLESRLDCRFFERPTEEVAKRLLGHLLLRKLNTGHWTGGKIVETEAYLSQDDPASHSFIGKTDRNAAMFGPPGTIYVYTIHAKHCVNFSTEQTDVGSAVLIRALEPIWGIEKMRINRKQAEVRKLTSGPAMICQALEIDLRENGKAIEKHGRLLLLSGEIVSNNSIVSTSRIGISRGQELPLRFFDAGSRFVSRSR
jgi:DNA-3-methyladenine glycosylase